VSRDRRGWRCMRWVERLLEPKLFALELKPWMRSKLLYRDRHRPLQTYGGSRRDLQKIQRHEISEANATVRCGRAERGCHHADLRGSGQVYGLTCSAATPGATQQATSKPRPIPEAGPLASPNPSNRFGSPPSDSRGDPVRQSANA